jgi:pyruvate kinase
VRRAKLICTLGPASSSSETVRALVDAGMDVARINFSHGTDDDHRRSLEQVREAAEASGRVVAALADLSGPKVRLGALADGHVFLKPGKRFVLRSRNGTGDDRGAATNHPGLAGDVEPGDRILLADGAVELVVRATGDDVVTEVLKVIRGGRVSNRAGVNVPAERLSLPPITEKDLADLDRAEGLGFDLVAQSFVRSARDVAELRSMMTARRIPIVAKIENRSAVGDAEAIAREAAGVMIARGDLGVEIPLEEIPVTQKQLIRICRTHGAPCIVATQMLESMLTSARPTRAEVTDTANAILDGADAVLLSGETAIGEFPVEAAVTAARVAEVAEEEGHAFRLAPPEAESTNEGQAIARAACRVVGGALDVAAVACFTRTGRTATKLAAERPPVPIFAFASDASLVRALAGVWGVTPLFAETPRDVDSLIAMMDRRLTSEGLVADGRTVVMVGAAPVGRAHTNLLKVHRLGSPVFS